MKAIARPRILFVVDYRSEIARGWIADIAAGGQAVSVVSTFPTHDEPVLPVTTVDLGFSRLVELRGSGTGAASDTVGRRLAARGLSSDAVRRLWHATNSSLMTLETRRHRATVQRVIDGFRPDLIHAMRIPYEAVLAATIRTRVPLLVSTWGNDLTLWATRRKRMAVATRRVLERADALHCDCRRDLALARQRGFPTARPAVVLPGGGGVDLGVFHPGPPDAAVLKRLGVPIDRPLVVNPRGIREYVRNEAFLEAWPLVLQSHPRAFAVGVGMAGSAQLARICHARNIGDSVALLPQLTPGELAEVFRAAQVSVSPTVHDGTPNTLLEAMASGCLPIAGDLDSIREWIDDGVNGLLFDATDPKSIAGALCRGLADAELRAAARPVNLDVIRGRADRRSVMDLARESYADVASTETEPRQAAHRRTWAAPRATDGARPWANGVG